jgi:hypothetical protein
MTTRAHQHSAKTMLAWKANAAWLAPFARAFALFFIGGTIMRPKRAEFPISLQVPQ